MRLPSGGRIDRSRPLRFTFDGVEHVGYAGDTLASALLADGVVRVATSITYGRPRGIVSAGVEEPSALVQVETPFPEPMLAATTVELHDGLVARGLAGRGTLATGPDPARYDARHLHCDLLVVGAGPAGLAAGLAAARAGERVVLVDDQPEPGGSLLSDRDGVPDWATAAIGELLAGTEVTVLPRTSAFGCYDDGFVLAVQDRPRAAARQRIWRLRARRTVLATGAHERPIVFADNDRPGIMLAGAARTYLNRYGVLAGNRVVVFTTNDSAYAAAADLADAGAAVTVLDARPANPGPWAEECARRGITVRLDCVVTGTDGEDRVTKVRTSAGELPCDLLLVSGGWNPAVHLFSQARGRLRYDDRLGAFVPAGGPADIEVAGSATGAGLATPAVIWAVPGDGPRFVDLQRDATVDDILRATGAGLTSVEHVKRYTTIGTAHDQGKTSGVIASGIVAAALGVPVADLGLTTFRPPYASVSFAALAGRDRGDLFDPVRLTALHPWHEANGALFENVGQWKRPWYYPRAGEDLTAAVLRECRAARTGVAMMDASTLGKIDLRGADVGEFLDRLYPNMMSTLTVGSVRYGAMCGVEGMIIDDGTVLRLTEDRFVLTTTTGNAAMVLDWMEEWLQTEWPELRVSLTSVTDHWATVALVGPESRQVLAAVAPGLDVSKAAFPFMTWRDTTVAGLAARVCRISFSGELAYEVNVPSWDGPAVWEALLAAGQAHGITPYGTETMHVLRAEKGFPIIGQDTDGTVTPQDLGMGWIVSKKKADFLGKRSHTRADNLRPDRKHLVGLLPVDRSVLLDEGAQILADLGTEPPVRMLGHVTSSYRSAALGGTFALAMVKSGRDRLGETLYAWQGGEPIAVEVTGPVLYDQDGARRDG